MKELYSSRVEVTVQERNKKKQQQTEKSSVMSEKQ